MINLNTGAIEFDDGLNIDTRTPLEKMELVPGAKAAPSITGRSQLSLGAHPAQSESWGVGVTYVGLQLTHVGLMCLTADGVDRTAWTLENEKLRQVIHNTFVKKLCSSNGVAEQTANSLTYKFPWGRVASLLDLKGAQALIMIEYL